mmetsp:Transcript_21028/g.39098  ORF Transcript_21028/g.39098 Transcript_21028/m.39098 type:complete len:1840 (-) Transcript_21028:122-5641(-)
MKWPQATLLFVAQVFWTGLIEWGDARSDTFMKRRSSIHVPQASSLSIVSSSAVTARAVQAPPGLEEAKKHRHFEDGGCQNIKGATTRDKNMMMLGSPDMSHMVCYIFCMKRKTIYFATRAGEDCVCMDHYQQDNATATCDVACKGDSAENCGGEKSWSVHIMSAWVAKWEEKPCGPCPAVQYSQYSRPEGDTAIPTTCEVQCIHGYGVAVNNLLCDTTRGVWVGTAMCQERICATPPRIPNSSHVCSQASVAKNDGACNVTCLPGFMLQTNTLKCTASGSGKEIQGVLTGEAICKAGSCELSTIYPNTIAVQVPPEFGEKVTSTCAPGFSLDGTKHGPTTFTSVCQEDGKMSHTDATCKPMMCGQALPVIKNAKALLGKDKGIDEPSPGLFYPNSTTYKCFEGYQLAQSLTGEKRFEVSCQVTGDWTEFPSCEKISCGLPPIVPNAVLVGNASKTLHFEDKVLYKCQDGYTLDKDMTEKKDFQLTCNADTLFSHQPTCVRVSCGDPLGVVKGAKIVPKFIPEAFFGDKLEYECPKGFTPTGHASDPASVFGECLANGNIQLSDPATSECVKVSCNMTALSVAHIVWDAEAVQTIAVGVKAFDKLPYTCAEYYSTDGSYSPGAKKSFTMCGADGKFTEPEVKCKNIDDCIGHTCGPFGSCVDGLGNYSCACIMNKTQKTDKVTGELVCGDPWECGPRECGAGTCVDLINEYTCDCPVGHPLLTYNDGKDKACSDEPVACGLAPQIANSKPVSKKMVYGDSATYICKAGYNTSDGSTTADGQPGFVVTCGAHPDDSEQGKFFGMKTCVPVKCGFPPLAESPMITYTLDKEISYPDAATYTCPAGQTASAPKGLPVSKGGSKTFNRSCLATGKFSPPSGECDWVTCAISVVPRMVLEPNPGSIRYGKSKFTCKDGYTLDPLNPSQGDVMELTCQEDGTIVGVQHCEPITCKAPIVSEDGGAKLMKASQQQLVAPWYEALAGEYVEYTRKEVGYYFIGDQGQEIHEFKAQCGPLGKMQGIKPSQKISCGKIPSVANGSPKNAASSTMSFKDVVTVQCAADYEMHPTIFTANKKPTNEKEFDLVCQGNTQISGLHGVPAGSACVLAVCNEPEQKCSEGGGICQPGAGIEGRPYICKCPKDYEYKIDAGDSVCAPIPKLTECPVGACGIHGQCLLADYTYSCDCDSGYVETNATGIKVCEKKTCPALAVVPNSTMTEPVTLKYADKKIVSCRPGFSVDGSSSSADFTVECRADATLTPLPTCRLVTCGLAPVVHFSKSLTVLNEAAPMELGAAEEAEDPPSMLPDAEKKKCKRNTGGTCQWSACYAWRGPTKCEGGKCLCQEGYCSVHGKCVKQETGASSPGMPKTSGTKTQPGTKIPGTKTKPTVPTHVFVAGETASYTCADGYSLDGKPSGQQQLLVQCQLDGSFQPVTHCEPITCGIPPGITNGEQGQAMQVAYPNTVAYECKPGYSFNASKLSDTHKRIKCQSNGVFTSTDGAQSFPKDVPLECQKISCGKPPEFSGSHRPDVATYFEEKVTYTCNAGHSITGAPGGDTEADSSCQVDGTYSLKAFPCKPIKVSIAGYVKDATNGMPIPGAQVSLTGTSAVVALAASGPDGKFNLQDVPLGNFTLKAQQNGYTEVSEDLNVKFSISEGTSADIFMNPTLLAGELRFVLTWNEQPYDLDPHLHWGPGGGGCHVYFNQPAVACGSYDGVSASLDIDDWDGYGPETITVKNLQKCKAPIGASQPYLGPDTCKFFYRVIKFSGEGYFTQWKQTSGAKVKVYAAKGLLATFEIAKDGFIDSSREMENWFAFGLKINPNGAIDIFKCEDASCAGGHNLNWGGFTWEE